MNYLKQKTNIPLTLAGSACSVWCCPSMASAPGRPVRAGGRGVRFKWIVFLASGSWAAQLGRWTAESELGPL